MSHLAEVLVVCARTLWQVLDRCAACPYCLVTILPIVEVAAKQRSHLAAPRASLHTSSEPGWPALASLVEFSLLFFVLFVLLDLRTLQIILRLLALVSFSARVPGVAHACVGNLPEAIPVYHIPS